MKKILPDSRFRIGLSVFAVCLMFCVAWLIFGERTTATSEGESGTLERMIVANGTASMHIDLNKINGVKSRSKTSDFRFDVEPNAFFTVLVFNDELRGSLPSSMGMLPEDSAGFPSEIDASQIVVESLPYGGPYEMAIRDGRTGMTYFNIEGHTFDYDAKQHLLTIQDGRLLVSDEFAAKLGQSVKAGAAAGTISVSLTMKTIELTKVVNGEINSEVLPALGSSDAGSVPGPDVIVGDVTGLAQFGSSSGTQVGLAVGTDSCNFGTIDLNWFANPSNDHPVIPQNLYRMSGGTDNTQRFEQVGQSSVKHAFTALTQNLCALGCNGVGGSRLGSGCSDPYGASLNAGPNLGSKAWINPFTGAYPRGDTGSPTHNNNHTGHTHAGPTHRILTEIADLVPASNPGATYYAEAQYVTPHEYAWCQANPTQCNMYNNVSHRRYTVNGSASPFSFSPVAATVRQKAAITAWTGATIVEVRPAPGADGIAFIGYKVTNTAPGVWHYEYAIYNQNLDRAIQSFSVPYGTGVTLSNVGFHAPPQHPGMTFDGTADNAGFSSTAWTQTEADGYVSWGSETFLANQNANAVRWGTMYNIRFDSNRPPMTTFGKVGFLKTGSAVSVRIQGPSSGAINCSRTPQGNRC